MLPDSPEKRVHLTKLLRGRNSSTKGFYVIVQPKLAPLLTPQRVNGFIYQIGFYRLYSFKKKTTPYCPMLVLITRLKFSEQSSCENTPKAPFLPKVLFLSTTALAMRSISGRLYHGQRSKKNAWSQITLPVSILSKRDRRSKFRFPSRH